MSLERTKQRDLTRNLYSLERRFGVPADLYKVNSVTPSIELGRDGLSVTKYVIKRFITHSMTVDQKFDYALGYLRANSNFTYGGIYTPNDRVGIIRNVLGLIELTTKDYIIYDGKPYAIQEIITLDYRLGWILQLRHTPGTKFYRIYDRAVWSRVTSTQDLGATL